jgi:cell division septum initiation protein DivIVA
MIMQNNLSQVAQLKRNMLDSFIDKTANIATETKNTLDQLEKIAEEPTQSLNNLANRLNQSIQDFNEVTTNFKSSLLEATGGAVNKITEATNSAANTLKESTQQATGVLNDAANVAAHRLNDATSSITQTTEKTKLALDETLQKAEQLSGTVSNSVQDLVAHSAQTWIVEHPTIAWTIAHPLWSLALVLLVLFLGWSLLAAIASLTQRSFLFILQAPLKLIQLLLKAAFQLFRGSNTSQLVASSPQQDQQKRLFEILSRLETLRQEQEILMGEIRSILLSKH